MAVSPELFVETYSGMVDAARRTKAWQDWKPSPEFCKYLDADWDRVFGKANTMPEQSKVDKF